MSSNLYLGVDIGTSVAKGAIINDIGELINQASYNRKHIKHSQKKYEHNPELVWWKEFVFIVRKMVTDLGKTANNIQGIAVTGMAPNIYPINNQGKSLHNAILYYDPRAASIEKTLDEELKTPEYANQVLSMIIWLKNELGPRWEKVDKILTTHNYIVYKITNNIYMDSLSALEFGNIYDSVNIEWNRDLLQKYGIDENIFPDVVTPGQIVGNVTKYAFQETGLKEGIPVIAGTSDTISSFLGAGARKENDLLIYYGTYNCSPLLLCNIENIIFTKIRTYPLNWITSIKRGGQQLSNFAQQFCPEDSVNKSLLKLDKLAEASTPGANNVIFIQELNFKDAVESTEPQAAIFNFGLNNTLSDVCRSSLEAFGYGLKYSFELLDSHINPTRIFAAGGGARSKIWKTIVSDITGFEQLYFPFADRAFGSAMLAAISIDVNNMENITEFQFNNLEKVIPDFEKTKKYNISYKKYKSFIEHYMK